MADSKVSDLTAKATPVAADITNILDSAAANADKKITLGNIPLTGNIELKALATGLLKNTTTTGTPSIAVQGTDYLAPIDPAPDADHGYSGTVISGTAGEALAINNLVYLKSDGKFWKAKADAVATLSAVGIATAAADAEAAIVVLLWGYIRNDDGWGGDLTIGSHGAGRIWVSEATAGLATQTAPASTNYAQLIGYGIGVRTAFFHFCPTFYEVA